MEIGVADDTNIAGSAHLAQRTLSQYLQTSHKRLRALPSLASANTYGYSVAHSAEKQMMAFPKPKLTWDLITQQRLPRMLFTELNQVRVQTLSSSSSPCTPSIFSFSK